MSALTAAKMNFYASSWASTFDTECNEWYPRGLQISHMGQNDTIGKIELKIIFRLAVGISNSKNDIQLFLQLFDELRVNGDYH